MVVEHLLQHCSACLVDDVQALHVMLPDLGDTATAYLKLQSDSFYGANGAAPDRVEVVPTFVPSGQINSEIEFELEHNLTNSHDGWILDPMGLGSIYSYGGFQDLTRTVNPAAGAVDLVRWSDIHPFFRSTSNYYDASTKQLYVVTLPLDGNVRMLYYRADSFKALGLQVPRTWEEVVELATAFNAAGMDLNGDNVTDYGFCFDRRKGGSALAMQHEGCTMQRSRQRCHVHVCGHCRLCASSSANNQCPVPPGCTTCMAGT